MRPLIQDLSIYKKFNFENQPVGMKSHHVFPEGWILLSIPYQRIPTVTQNLQEMKWVLPSYEDAREKFLKRKMKYIQEINEESLNP